MEGCVFGNLKGWQILQTTICLKSSPTWWVDRDSLQQLHQLSANLTTQQWVVGLTTRNNVSMWMHIASTSLKGIRKSFMSAQKTSTSIHAPYPVKQRTPFKLVCSATMLQWHLFIVTQVWVRMTSIQTWLSWCFQARWTGQLICGILRSQVSLFVPLKAPKNTSMMYSGVQRIQVCLLHVMQKVT